MDDEDRKKFLIRVAQVLGEEKVLAPSDMQDRTLGRIWPHNKNLKY